MDDFTGLEQYLGDLGQQQMSSEMTPEQAQMLENLKKVQSMKVGAQPKIMPQPDGTLRPETSSRATIQAQMPVTQQDEYKALKEKLQGAVDQSLNTQQSGVAQMEQGLNDIKRSKNAVLDTDWSPLMSWFDSGLGTNTAQSYKKPMSQAEKQKMIMDIEQQTQKAREGVTASEIDSLKALLNDKTQSRYLASMESASKDRARQGQRDFSNITGLRKEYSGDPLTKNTKEITQAYKKIQAAALGGEGASDMSLVYGYMKMLDPGSTVREGEYASAEQTRGIPESVAAAYEKARTGKKLSPQQRESFVREAGQVYEAQMQNQRELDSFYGGLAKDAGYDPKKVLVQFGASGGGKFNPVPAAQGSNNSPPPTSKKTIGDKSYSKGPDGKWYED